MLVDHAHPGRALQRRHADGRLRGRGRPGAGAQPTAGQLDAHCLAAIARFKRPKRYVFVDALPKNNYGKVLKTALREQLAAP